MLSNLLARFNYPDKSSLYPTLTMIKVFGMWFPGRSINKLTFYVIFVVFSLAFVGSVIFNLITNFNYDLFIDFVQYSSFYVGIQKTVVMGIHHKRWETYISFVAEIEAESTAENSEHGKIVYKYKNYCQCLTYTLWILVSSMLMFFIVVFWMNNVFFPLVFNSGELDDFKCLFYAWLPFDQNSVRGRFYSAILQTLYAISGVISTWTFDTLLMSSLVFFAGQLKALRLRCVNALNADDEEQCWKNIVKCHQHHIAIISCKNYLNSLIWSITFVNFLQVSSVFGICIIKIALDRRSTADLVRTIDLIAGCNLELLLFYNIANEVIVQNEPLSYGLFESKWYKSSARVRKALYILSIGMQQRVAFTAGPFAEMSLATYVTIIRASYSFYTLLSQTH